MAQKQGWLRKAILGSSRRAAKVASKFFLWKQQRNLAAGLAVPVLSDIIKGADRMVKLISNFFWEELPDMIIMLGGVLGAPYGLAITAPTFGQWLSKIILKVRLSQKFSIGLARIGAWSRPIYESGYFYGNPSGMSLDVDSLKGKMGAAWWDGNKPWPALQNTFLATASGFGEDRFKQLFSPTHHEATYVSPNNFTGGCPSTFGRYIMAHLSHRYVADALARYGAHLVGDESSLQSTALDAAWVSWATANNVGYDTRKTPGA